jgi:hypothetical protein
MRNRGIHRASPKGTTHLASSPAVAGYHCTSMVMIGLLKKNMTNMSAAPLCEHKMNIRREVFKVKTLHSNVEAHHVCGVCLCGRGVVSAHIAQVELSAKRAHERREGRKPKKPLKRKAIISSAIFHSNKESKDETSMRTSVAFIANVDHIAKHGDNETDEHEGGDHRDHHDHPNSL